MFHFRLGVKVSREDERSEVVVGVKACWNSTKAGVKVSREDERAQRSQSCKGLLELDQGVPKEVCSLD
jgi:hypothetical protein